MGFLEDLKANLRGDPRRSSAATDQELVASLAKIRQASKIDLEALAFTPSDMKAYRILIATVKVSNAQNEDLAQLHARIGALGEDIVRVAKEAARPL